MNAPERPNESVEDVGGRAHDVFLEPEISGFVGKGDTSAVDRLRENSESLVCGIEVARVAGFLVSAN